MSKLRISRFSEENVRKNVGFGRSNDSIFGAGVPSCMENIRGAVYVLHLRARGMYLYRK
jgi:hypothetical protein